MAEKQSSKSGDQTQMLEIVRVVLIIIILGISVSPIDADNGATQQPARNDRYGEFNLPPKVMELLRKEGVTISDLKNDSNLRRKWLNRLRVLGGAKPAKPAGDDFYQVIITNNLFRPLGYRKPSPPPPYQLIATVINHGQATNKALLRHRKDGRMYYVGLGEVFSGAKVERIEPKSVTLLIGGQSMKFRLPRAVLLQK